MRRGEEEEDDAEGEQVEGDEEDDEEEEQMVNCSLLGLRVCRSVVCVCAREWVGG